MPEVARYHKAEGAAIAAEKRENVEIYTFTVRKCVNLNLCLIVFYMFLKLVNFL